MPHIEYLTCQQCDGKFLRAVTGTPGKWCSKRCRNRAQYLRLSSPSRRNTGVRAPKKCRQRTMTEARRAYSAAYQQRPEVKERNRLRRAAEYRPHPRPARRVEPTPEVAAPYTGHQWLEMARRTVGYDLDRSQGERAEWRQDEMGEALLALMEGRDPRAAVIAYRKREFVARHLTQHIGEWTDRDEAWRMDVHMPSVPSAEDEVIARETVFLKFRYHGGQGKGLMGTSRQQRPSQRRRNAA